MYAPNSDNSGLDIEKRLAEINQKWGETPSDFDGCAWIIRVLVADSLRPDPGGTLRSVPGPVVQIQLFDEKISEPERCDDRLASITLELVTGFIDGPANGLVVAGIVTVAGAAKNDAALERGIKQLLEALDAKRKRILEQHRDLFADAGILTPMAPVATAEEVLELVEMASAEHRARSLNCRPDRLH